VTVSIFVDIRESKEISTIVIAHTHPTLKTPQRTQKEIRFNFYRATSNADAV